MRVLAAPGPLRWPGTYTHKGCGTVFALDPHDAPPQLKSTVQKQDAPLFEVRCPGCCQSFLGRPEHPVAEVVDA